MCTKSSTRIGFKGINLLKKATKLVSFKYVSTTDQLPSSVDWFTKRCKYEFIISRKTLIMTTKWSKAWKCENYKDSFRFTWCNCWFKQGCSLVHVPAACFTNTVLFLDLFLSFKIVLLFPKKKIPPFLDSLFMLSFSILPYSMLLLISFSSISCPPNPRFPCQCLPVPSSLPSPFRFPRIFRK